MYAEPVPTICRKYIEIRYRLIQYIYDAMYENTLCGKPICRPLFMDEIKPGDKKILEIYSLRNDVNILEPSFPPGGVLPYISYIGMCGSKGYGF